MNLQISRWLEFTITSILMMSGIIMLMWYPVRMAWFRIHRDNLPKNYKIRFSILTGLGAFLVSSSSFPLLTFLFPQNEALNVSLGNYLSFFICSGPFGILIGISATLGEYIWLTWIERSSKKVDKD